MSGETEDPGVTNEIISRGCVKILYSDGGVGFGKPQNASFFEKEEVDTAKHL